MRKEFVMRGQTASGSTEVLNFGKYKPGYGYKITEFTIYPSSAIGAANIEMCGSVTAGKTAVNPQSPDFNDDGLLATAMFMAADTTGRAMGGQHAVVNDTFIITQNLILMVFEVNSTAVNWECKFESVKMSASEEAAINYKQFTISDDS